MNKKNLIIIGIIIAASLGYFAYTKITATSTKVQYQTATAVKSSVISTISASGSIAGGNNTTIYTNASGLVTKVYVKNGDSVVQGQKLASISLDQSAKQQQASAWATYLSATISEKNAENNKLSLVSSVDSANQSLMNSQNSVNVMNDNINNNKKSYTDLEKNSTTSTQTIAQENLAIAQNKLATADDSISAAKSQVSAAWYAYQQSSATITAPASGILTSFTLTPGISVNNLTNTSSTSSNTNATQSVGIIVNPKNQVTATVNLTEIDVVKAKPGQKATITMDAFSDKTFTGQILAINTNGSVSSGVSSYPTIIVFDSGLTNMYPNMSVTAKIIVDSRDEVINIPSSAIKSSNGQSTVQILKNNLPSTVTVETGLTDGTNTEIISGISENDVVITSTTSSSKTSTTTSGSSSGSVFGGSNLRGIGR